MDTSQRADFFSLSMLVAHEIKSVAISSGNFDCVILINEDDETVGLKWIDKGCFNFVFF